MCNGPDIQLYSHGYWHCAALFHLVLLKERDMSNAFNDALNNIFGRTAGGKRITGGPTSGITRTVLVANPVKLHRVFVINDPLTNAADTQAFWSLDDSILTASGSGGAAIIGQFIGEVTGSNLVSNQPFL